MQCIGLVNSIGINEKEKLFCCSMALIFYDFVGRLKFTRILRRNVLAESHHLFWIYCARFLYAWGAILFKINRRKSVIT